MPFCAVHMGRNCEYVCSQLRFFQVLKFSPCYITLQHKDIMNGIYLTPLVHNFEVLEETKMLNVKKKIQKALISSLGCSKWLLYLPCSLTSLNTNKCMGTQISIDACPIVCVIVLKTENRKTIFFFHSNNIRKKHTTIRLECK